MYVPGIHRSLHAPRMCNAGRRPSIRLADRVRVLEDWIRAVQRLGPTLRIAHDGAHIADILGRYIAHDSEDFAELIADRGAAAFQEVRYQDIQGLLRAITRRLSAQDIFEIRKDRFHLDRLLGTHRDVSMYFFGEQGIDEVRPSDILADSIDHCRGIGFLLSNKIRLYQRELHDFYFPAGPEQPLKPQLELAVSPGETLRELPRPFYSYEPLRLGALTLLGLRAAHIKETSHHYSGPSPVDVLLIGGQWTDECEEEFSNIVSRYEPLMAVISRDNPIKTFWAGGTQVISLGSTSENFVTVTFSTQKEELALSFRDTRTHSILFASTLHLYKQRRVAAKLKPYAFNGVHERLTHDLERSYWRPKSPKRTSRRLIGVALRYAQQYLYELEVDPKMPMDQIASLRKKIQHELESEATGANKPERDFLVEAYHQLTQRWEADMHSNRKPNPPRSIR